MRSSPDTWIAATRFGLGPRPGELMVIRRDPRAWVRDQLNDRRRRTALDNLQGHVQIQRDAYAAVRGTPEEARKSVRRFARQRLRVEATARLRHATRTGAPVLERLVRFWSNHFTVSATRRRAIHLVGAFEREAIRPHITGRFGDMLLASCRHPAMLLYLDNAQSMGPDTRRARRRERGLNENLAREVLELHTLGVGGGYDQDDVEGLAKLLTGWTVFGGPPLRRPKPDIRHGFIFREDLHQPGTKQLLGRTYGEGRGAAEEALVALARHPATARHIARKLATHFSADDPSPDLVTALEREYLQTGGDLRAVYMVLVEHEDSWSTKSEPKLRAPAELVIAMGRALGLWRRDVPRDWAEQGVVAESWLGQPALSAPSPAGWPDVRSAWAGPEQLARRVEIAWQVGVASGDQVPDPSAWAEEIAQPVLSRATRRAVAGAPSRGEAVAIVLASPEFQWRG